MSKLALAIQFAVSLCVGSAINFFILRAVLGKLDRPQDERRRTQLAAAVALLLSLSSAVNSRRVAAAEIEAART